MKGVLLIASLATLAVAKPGLYKEKEDFQYSRSSTDEGSKSGFYGAQRGNMGGNYERAHNMDGLAQHQMSGLVRQVEGELGEGSKTRTGSVFTAANSRGVYGSGHYDLSNLEGRNFQEGGTYGDSQSQSQMQSHSSLTAQSGYNTHHSSGYNAQASGQNSQSSDYSAQSSALNSAAYSNRRSHGSKLQDGYNGYQYLGYHGAEDNLQQSINIPTVDQYDYGGHGAAGYYSQSRYNDQNRYDLSRSNLRNDNSYGSNVQTRVISGMPVKVILRPGTRVTVPIATQTYYDASNSAAYEQKSANSDAELLNNKNQHSTYETTGPKHYESSYSYRKEWEKHDTQPVTVLPIAVPTSNPFPKNSELYEDAQSLSTGQQYESNGFGSHSHSSNSYDSYNANDNFASSSQSHHQSKLNTQNQRSDSAAATDSNASSQGIYNSAKGADTTNQIEDADTKPKSYHSSYSYHKSWERQGDPYVIKPASSGYNTQASQRLTAASSNQGSWSSHRYGSRHQHADQNSLNLEDCDCDENGHIRIARSYNTDQYEDQHTYQQNINEPQVLSQQSQNLEDLRQQSQNKWDKIEDLGQQTQNQWDQLGDVGQQAQNKWDKLEDLGQQAQNKWDQSEDLVQQTQNKWDKLQENAGQQPQSHWDKFENDGQQTQNQWDKLEDLGQQTQSTWDHFDGQQSQLDVGQQLQNTWSQLESSSSRNMGHETQTKLENLNIHTTANNNKLTRHQIDTESHKPNSVPLSEQNENNKETSHHNFEMQGSNFFGLHSSISPKEQAEKSSTINNENIPKQPQNPWNVNTPYNTYDESFDKTNIPTSNYNYLINPSLDTISHVPQSSEHTVYNNHDNQQTHAYNAWPLFTTPLSLNTWQETSINHRDVTENKSTNTDQGISTLWNLWDKVDTIEKQTISSNKNKTEVSQTLNYSHTEPIFGQTPHNDYIIQSSMQNKPLMQMPFGHNAWKSQDSDVEVSTTSKSTTKRAETTTVDINPAIANIKPLEGKSPPSDVGRGDIGPEDNIRDNTPQSNTQELFNEFGTQPTAGMVVSTTEHKHYKTPAEIEALSQIIVEVETTTDCKESNVNSNSDVIPKHTFTSSTTLRTTTEFNERGREYQNLDQYNGKTVTIESEEINKFDQSNLQQSVSHFEQQSEHFKEEDIHQEYESKLNGAPVPFPSKEPSENNNKQIPKVENDINSSVLSQGSETNNANRTNKALKNPWNDNANTPVNIYNSWFHQMPHKPQNRNQPQSDNYNNQRPDTDTYNDHILNIGQQSDTFDQQNTDQKFENFDHLSEIFGQQSENFGQQVENFGQKSVNFGQQSEHFGQQIENFGQQSENFEQQSGSFGQQSENFGQQSVNFEQQSVNVGQQSENFGQQIENFEQSENFEQQSGSFGQQSENFGQQSVNFGQQSENFGQQSENFGQQSENFEQSKNLDENTDQQFEIFEQQVAKKELPTQNQFGTLGQKLDKFDIQGTEQELLNLAIQNDHKIDVEKILQNPKNIDQQQRELQFNLNNVSPIEPVHNIENIGSSSERNIYNTYNEQQDEKLNHYEDMKQIQHQNFDKEATVQETKTLEVIPVEKPVYKIEIPEDKTEKSQIVENKELTSTSTSTDSLPETEKPGFWKSVGSKFVSAKDKVISWFSNN